MGWWYVYISSVNLKLSDTVFRIHDAFSEMPLLFHAPFPHFPFALLLLPTGERGEKACLARLHSITMGHAQKLCLALQLQYNKMKESVVH